MEEIDYQLDDFLLYCDSKKLSGKTLASYEQTLRLFIAYLEEAHSVTAAEGIRTVHIRSYIKLLRERGKYTVGGSPLNKQSQRNDYGKEISATTIANYLRNIKVFFSYLTAEHIITSNPAKPVANIKPERKKKKLLSEQELKRVMRSFDTSTFHGYRSYVMTRLILDTGVRIGECVEIKPEHVDLRNCVALLVNPKNNEERYVYFSKKTSRELKRWFNYRDRYSDSEFLFPTIRGTQLSVNGFERTLKNIGKQCGVEVAPHLLRNNFAKYYLLNGGDLATLSRLLGHSDVKVTEKSYLDFTDEEVGRKYQRHSPMNNLNI